MLDRETVRLEILKLIVPITSRLGINEPERIVATCKTLEEYVSSAQREDVPASHDARKPGRPRKEISEHPMPAFLDPAAADKSNLPGQA